MTEGDTDAPLGFTTQAVRCPRCDIEHSPGYPHHTPEDCNAALVGTRLLNLETERDRLREALERIADPRCMVMDGYIDTREPQRIAREALDACRGPLPSTTC